jgi:hypothetical protein
MIASLISSAETSHDMAQKRHLATSTDIRLFFLS